MIVIRPVSLETSIYESRLGYIEDNDLADGTDGPLKVLG